MEKNGKKFIIGGAILFATVLTGAFISDTEEKDVLNENLINQNDIPVQSTEIENVPQEEVKEETIEKEIKNTNSNAVTPKKPITPTYNELNNKPKTEVKGEEVTTFKGAEEEKTYEDEVETAKDEGKQVTVQNDEKTTSIVDTATEEEKEEINNQNGSTDADWAALLEKAQ